MTFRERFMAGECEFDEIFELTDKWNRSDELCTLRVYLGLTAEEEDIWISESDDALEEYMEAERSRKIFFTDLDDTLLNSEKNVSPRNAETLQKVLAAGHYVTISTGRALPSALDQAHRLHLDSEGCFVIAYNGGNIYDIAGKKLLYRNDIPVDLMTDCLNIAQEMDIHIQAYSDTSVIVSHDSPEVAAYCSIQTLSYEAVEDIAARLPQGTPKLLCICNDVEKLLAFKERIATQYGSQLDLFFSTKTYLEIVPKGINKGNAVRFMAEALGVPMKNTVSAGDQENDLTMIETAGVGCAMANAVPAVKEKADYVTVNDMNHDGVAEILEKFVL